MSHSEDLGIEHTSLRPVLARVPRDLLLAEEIIRFPSISDRPSTSGSTHKIKIVSNSSRILNEFTKEQNELKSVSVRDGHHLVYEATYPQSLSAVSAVVEAETWDSVTGQQSNNVQEPNLQIPGDEDLVDQRLNSCPIRSRKFRPNLIPVTNSILAAIARNEAAGNTSDGPIILKLVDDPDDKDKYWPTTRRDMLDIYMEDYERLVGSDYFGSDLPISLRSNKTPSPCIADHSEEILSKKKEVKIICSLLNAANAEIRSLNKLLKSCKSTLTQKKKSKIIVNDVNRLLTRAESNEDDAKQEIPDQEKPNDQIDANTSIYNRMKEYVGNDSDSSTDSWTTVDPLDNESSNDSYDSDSDYSNSSKDPPELRDVNDDSFGADWTEGEKLRLRIILRNMSRKIKPKELQNKRLKLKRNGRMLTQAIENKINAITTEIQAVHKKQLSQVALPLEEMQDYDWTQVAAMANRSPEECQRAWELFIHPSKNT